MAKDREGKHSKQEGGRLAASVPVLAVAGATGIGILVALYPAANKQLPGLLLILAVALGGAAVLLLTEAVNRGLESRSWWGPAAFGAVIAIASLLLALLPGSEESAAEPKPDGGLRLSLRPAEPEFFSVAFDREIGLPAPREDWSDLRARGALDVADSSFHMILANDSPEPISVLGLRALVARSEPIPNGTFAWHPAQGDEAIPQMTTMITNARPESSGQIYEGYLSADRPLPPSTYFQSKYILLKPGEVYPVEMTVRADPERTIHYRFVASGASATRRFVARSRALAIVGWIDDPDQRKFGRYYRLGAMPWECNPMPENPWVDVGPAEHSPACPEGLSSPTDVPAPQGLIQRTPSSR